MMANLVAGGLMVADLLLTVSQIAARYQKLAALAKSEGRDITDAELKELGDLRLEALDELLNTP